MANLVLAFGVGMILLSGVIFFFSLQTSLEAALENTWAPFCAGIGAVVILINTFTKSREAPAIIVRQPHGHGGHGHHGHAADHDDDEDDDHHEEGPQPQREPIAVVFGVMMYTLYTWPIHHRWWEDAFWAIPTLLVWIALFFVFILSPGQYRPPASLFWGLLCAWGADFLHWGLFGTSWAGKGLNGSMKTGQMSLWVLATCSWITVTVVAALVMSAKISAKNLIFFDIETAKVKAIKAGSTVMYFIADLTGVPRAIEPVPAHILRQGYEATWAWMLLDPARRMDIRPFLTNWGWIGPAFGYFGIPFFTSVVEFAKALLGNHGAHGAAHGHGGHGKLQLFGELRIMPNIDKTSPSPVPAGVSGVEMTVKIGVVLQLCNPYRVFSTPDIEHTLEHAVESLTADLGRVIGTAIYGFSGDPMLLLNQIPGQPRNSISPATDPINPQPAIEGIVRNFVHHLNEVGYHVVELLIKDVDITGNVQEILIDRVRTHVQRTVAVEKADTIRIVTRATLQAFMDAAGNAATPEMRVKILEHLAKMFFVSGASGVGQDLGFVVAAGQAVQAAQAGGGNAPRGNAGGGRH